VGARQREPDNDSLAAPAFSSYDCPIKEEIMRKKQFTLYLENRPGVLAAITRKLAAAKINIEGISVSETTDVGLVQLVPSNAAAAKRVLQNAGVPFTLQDVELLTLKNRAGELAKMASKLARSGININYIYATGSHCNSDCKCYAVVSAPDLKAVKRVWNGKR